MYFKELRQQHPGRIGKVRPCTALDLREIALADRFAELLLDHPGKLLLGELTAEPAECAFDLPQVPKFFTERHIAICDYSIAICDRGQEENSPCFEEDRLADDKSRFDGKVPIGVDPRSSAGQPGFMIPCFHPISSLYLKK
jgi:hypothetical protein